MALGIICDFIPIMLILVFHYRNFRVRKEAFADQIIEEVEDDNKSEEEIIHL